MKRSKRVAAVVFGTFIGVVLVFGLSAEAIGLSNPHETHVLAIGLLVGSAVGIVLSVFAGAMAWEDYR